MTRCISSLVLACTFLCACSSSDDSDPARPSTPRDMTRPDASTPEDMAAMPDSSTPPADMATDIPADSGGACGWSGQEEPGLVRTQAGAVQGSAQDNDTWAFLGIPYAASPAGERRWRAPQPLACYESQPLQAKAFGEKCVQRSFLGTRTGSEDCLTLNVWAPADYARDEKRPVLVFIHGGANVTGSASETFLSSTAYEFNGKYIAAEDAVIVTLQYRLGALGYLALPELTAEAGLSGTYGLLDQIEALTWVQANIAGFGGDPDRVQIFGSSAGAYNVCALVASPKAKGLFSSAVMQSGSCSVTALEEAERAHGAAVDQIEACQGEADRLACLRGLDADILLETMPGSVALLANEDELPYGAVVDGRFLTATPLEVFVSGEHNKVPFAVGSNADEMDIAFLLPQDVTTPEQYEAYIGGLVEDFELDADADARLLEAYPLSDFESPQKAIANLLTDVLFTCRALDAVQALSLGQDEPVYRFLFSRRPPAAAGGNLLAVHTLEQRYVFGSLRDAPDTPAPLDLTLSEAMLGMWINLAATGDPNTPDAPDLWPTYSFLQDNYIDFGDTVTARQGLRLARCDAWFPQTPE